MRIVIDLQAAQSSGSRNRGIGRYSLSLAKAMAQFRGTHEIVIVLNGLFSDSIEPIRLAFKDILPREAIRVWETTEPVAQVNSDNDWRRKAAERLYEAFLASLEPDVVHVSSLFEGLGDNAVTSIGALYKTPTAVTLYDLIPYIHPKPYLEDTKCREWYLEKIEYLRHANLWLAISESSRREGVDRLGLSDDWSINISTDADVYFRPREVSLETERALRIKYGLEKPFMMYTGGIDYRKNIEGLIRAFAKLPNELRAAHQLAIVCSVQPSSRETLEQLAAQAGLSRNAVVLTGFVPEEDLLLLYNLCALFVFPSWYEGFGLPALEAMRCGAPVIGANTSSIPEVIGWDEALFDPHSDDAMTMAIERALTDEKFRHELIERAKTQQQRFSWEESARRAISAMERLHAQATSNGVSKPSVPRKLSLAYVSPLPPERSGIADYSAELLPALAGHYIVDVIVDQPEISDPWISRHCTARSVEWFLEHAHCYDRVLYHFGNSTYHQHMFEMLAMVPGVVVLHDFFLSGILSHMQWHNMVHGIFTDELFRSHGYVALHDYANATDKADIIWKYPCSLRVIQDARGVIVHSPCSLRYAEKWYGEGSNDWKIIPHMRNAFPPYERKESREILGFGPDDFIVCAFGILGPTKLNHRLLQAWIDSGMAKERGYLVFVGENHAGDYGRNLREKLDTKRDSNICITGWADTETYRRYLAAADVGVQLRQLSRGETSGSVLDCMNCGLATIVNANGSMADLPDEAVWKLPDEFSDRELIEALETLWRNVSKRRELGRAGREIIKKAHDPQRCAGLYAEAIEHFYRPQCAGVQALVEAVASLPIANVCEQDMARFSQSAALSFRPRCSPRQLLVDISELVQGDSKSGIRRVVRGLLWELLLNPPTGVRVEPVYAVTDVIGYRYARRFTQEFLGCPIDIKADDPIDFYHGDIFLGLDYQPFVVPAQRLFFARLRQYGVSVRFVVYDMLLMTMPQFFYKGDTSQYQDWLDCVLESDGAICISRSVADELSLCTASREEKAHPFDIAWFHLGADIDNSQPTKGIPADAGSLFRSMVERPSFLMVGTLEPRKGHKQVLEAFETFWNSGVDVNLVIVGKQGWMVDDLISKLRSHFQLGKRLFWLEGISDEYLEKIYAASTCLLAASYGEGFGLPLIEAAQHKLPIIARDIPVFREVAGKYAYYFSGTLPDNLANAIKQWLGLYEQRQHPKSDDMPRLTWRQSSNDLLNLLLKEK
jgi:glycosyltransferase involved in cell wall biosynthesis